MNFLDFVGHERAKLALVLNAVERSCGGVLLAGESGTGKSTLMRLFVELVSDQIPCVEVPLNVTQEALLGGLDIEASIKGGTKVYEPGILTRAKGGFLILDDLNLLPPEILAIIFSFLDSDPPSFVPIGTMCPQAGELSPHFLDRFGMWVQMGKIRDFERRQEIIGKVAIFKEFTNLQMLKAQIGRARSYLEKVSFTPEMEEYLIKLIDQFDITSHRAELFLYYAARAWSSFCQLREVKKEHLDKVAPLILEHRLPIKYRAALTVKSDLPRGVMRSKLAEQVWDDLPANALGFSFSEGQVNSEEKMPLEWAGEKMKYAVGDIGEECFRAEGSYLLKNLASIKDHGKRQSWGKRGKSRAPALGGRYLKSVPDGERDVAIDATIRTACPYQLARGRKDRLLISAEDLRYKERQLKAGNLFIFLIDASGSMGFRRKMGETKGAIEALLKDCYRKRDRIAMIAFRKNTAEVIHPPSRMTEWAIDKLEKLPTGGKTPLSRGLMAVYQMIEKEKHKRPTRKIVVLIFTDGKANQTITDSYIFEELDKICRLLRQVPEVDYVVVDTEGEAGAAARLAARLQATYYSLSSLSRVRLSFS